MTSILEDAQRLIERAKAEHQIDIVVISTGGKLTASALRKDDDRFYVAKRFDVVADTIVRDIEAVRDEILLEAQEWKQGQ